MSKPPQPWRGRQFTHSPNLEGLLEDLNGVSGLREDSDNDSEADSQPSIPPSNAMESSCVGAPNDWEDRMARQNLACNDCTLMHFATKWKQGNSEAQGY